MRSIALLLCGLVACGGSTEGDATTTDSGDDHVRQLDTSSDDTTLPSDAKKPPALDAIPPPSDAIPPSLDADEDTADTGAATDSTTTDAGPDAHCIDCVATKVAWGYVGGLAYTDTSSVTPCRIFEHRRGQTGKPDVSCMVDLLICIEGPGITAGDIDGRLADPDVAAALAKSSSSGTPTSFGKTIPGVAYFLVTRGAASIIVRSDCGTTPGCMPPPSGVQALVKLLKDVDGEQMKRPVCSGPFPGGW